MPIPQIGSKQFITMLGPLVHVAVMDVESITRREVNGMAWREVGKRGDPINVRTEADVADAVTTRAAYLAMQGTLQTVILPDGESVPNVMVRKVTPVLTKNVLKQVGGLLGNSTNTWFLVCDWVLIGSV